MFKQGDASAFTANPSSGFSSLAVADAASPALSSMPVKRRRCVHVAAVCTVAAVVAVAVALIVLGTGGKLGGSSSAQSTSEQTGAVIAVVGSTSTSSSGSSALIQSSSTGASPPSPPPPPSVYSSSSSGGMLSLSSSTGADSSLGISGVPANVYSGTAYSFIPVVSGGSGALAFSLAGSLPSGLALSSSSGEISGTSTALGLFSGLSLSVRDSVNQLSVMYFNLTVFPAVTLPAVTYDQGMGATDANGFVASFPFMPGTGPAKQIWLDTEAGTDLYNCLSPYPGYAMDGTGINSQLGAKGRGIANSSYGPCSDFFKALHSAQTGTGPYSGFGTIPNQFFFAEGQTFVLNVNTSHSWNFYGSGSAVAPTCFQSYDTADPLNLQTHGRAGTAGRGARPVWIMGSGPTSWPGLTNGHAQDFGGYAFRGLEFRDSRDTTAGAGVSYVACQHNMLFENMILNGTQLTLQNANSNPGFNVSLNNIIRKSALIGAWTSTYRAQGIFAAATNLTIEDSVFYHNGWMRGLTRAATAAMGGGTIFNQAIYVDGAAGGIVGRVILKAHRLVIVDPAAGGFSPRTDHIIHHNVMIDCPDPEIKGGGSASNAESPNGCIQSSWSQLMMGGADISTNLPRMQGFTAQNGVRGRAFYKHSLAVNNPGFGQVNNLWLCAVNSQAPYPTYMEMEHNRAYAFAPASKRLFTSVVPGGTLNYTDIDNISSDTSPMTNAQIYAAIGFADKQSFINSMVADPTRPWAYMLLQAAATGFNFDFNYMLA